MIISNETPSSLSTAVAASMTGKSESEPINIATKGVVIAIKPLIVKGRENKPVGHSMQ